MTYQFQTLDKTAVSSNNRIHVTKKQYRPYENHHYVPQNMDTVAGKLKECQALGPRLQLLENKIKQAQEKPIEKRETVTLKEPKKILEVKTEDLKSKQIQAYQMKKDKQIARLRFNLQTEKKKDEICKDRDKQKQELEQIKTKRFESLLEKQQIVREFHDKQKQKLVDIKAIKEHQSKKIAEERKQQKEYELMLQRELDEELKNMKQREVELKLQLAMGVYNNGDTMQYDTNFNFDGKTEKITVEGNRQQKRAHEVLRQQMVQERLKQE